MKYIHLELTEDWAKEDLPLHLKADGISAAFIVRSALKKYISMAKDGKSSSFLAMLLEGQNQ